MRKSTVVKIGIVLLLLLIFIGYNTYVKWEKTHFTVDSDAFNIKDSFAEVMDEEYKRVERLRLADQFNKVGNPDITENFPNEQRQLKIDKAWFQPGRFFAWFQPGRFFVLYSVNLQKNDQLPEDIPELNFSEVTMKTMDGDSKTFPIKESEEIGENVDYEGTVYDRRLYRGIEFELDYDSLEDVDLNYLEKFIDETGVITLDHATLTEHGDEEDNDTKNHVENLKVTDQFSEENYSLATIPLDEEIVLDNDDVIYFSQLELTMASNHLYLDSEKDDATIQGVGAYFTWEGTTSEQEIHSRHVYGNEGDQYILFTEFEEIPKQVDVNFKSISYMIDDDIEFEIPADYNATPQEIGDVEGITFFFEGYEEETDLSEDVIEVELSWNSSETKDIPTDSYNNMFMKHDLEMQLASMEYDEEIEAIKNSAMNILSINNEEGERPEYIDPYENPDHANAITAGDSITIFLDKSFVDEAEELHIKMENVTYEEKIEDINFQLNIPDEYVTEGVEETNS